MRLRIVSDGRTTQILDADTGQALENVLQVDWRAAPDGMQARVTLVPAEMDIVCDDVIVIEAPAAPG